MQNPIIIDCDTGRDDALAIWLAQALDLNLAGVVCSYGNTTLDNVLDNTARVLSLCGGDDVPLFGCAREPSRDHSAYQNLVLPRQHAAGNGLCNLALPDPTRGTPSPVGPDQLAGALKAIADQHGALEYVIIGPATNLAAVCEILGDAAKDVIARITMMGGKRDAFWAQVPGGDFNIIADPYAVEALIKSGIPMRFVPMDATWPIKLDLPELEALKTNSEPGETARALMIAHCRNFAPEPVFRFHDPTVILALLEDIDFEHTYVDIVTDDTDDNFGRLVEDVDGTYDIEMYNPDDALREKLLGQTLSLLGLS